MFRRVLTSRGVAALLMRQLLRQVCVASRLNAALQAFRPYVINVLFHFIARRVPAVDNSASYSGCHEFKSRPGDGLS